MEYKEFTIKEKIIYLRKQGLKLKEICKHVNLSIGTVGYHLKDIDLKKIKKPIVKKGYNKTITNEDIDLINDLRKEGKTYLEIAKIIGCGKSTVFIHIRDENKNLLKDENEEQRSRRKSLYVIDWKKEKRTFLVNYKGGKCERCGYNKCMEALDFHHKDPSKKDFNISGHSFSFERMKTEVDKCMLLCANCHREEHYNLKNKNRE